ncbi:MAG: ribbon-helix-helix domain-containing protein [Candidatus Thermoplasmatota archaeon]|nr:ribbon-helix-helix domain-containing protein [Candidatus Thermoplasmatota archaeon]
MGERVSAVISVRLPEEMVRELNSIAEMESCSRAKVIRDAIRLHLRDLRIFNALRDVKESDLKALEKMLAKRAESKR